jgi:YARHG domain
MRAALVSTFVAAMTLTGVAVTAAQAQDICTRLWVERNQIYKNEGYCFKTARAIRYFGNAGCIYDNEADVPLSRAERERIAYLISQERRFGCR